MGKVILTEIQKRFADADALGHINNVNLQHYFDLGKMDFYAKVIGKKTVAADKDSLILVSTHTDYLAQTLPTDDIYVETAVQKIGTKSVTFFQRLINRGTGAVNAQCRTVAVAFDFEIQESVELKSEWKLQLRDYLLEESAQ